ncbi:zona pellucida sperm-binding protein 3-like [Protopterus annectens]|uniref:zona pellucida sperm-binding protein 3-like n=1 Tax=Protopterus annectens TaxID=7888 RepID=UPI001CF97581|nr:zona pellucida sperm-binding protein 3-like [Protopterus annectens]
MAGLVLWFVIYAFFLFNSAYCSNGWGSFKNKPGIAQNIPSSPRVGSFVRNRYSKVGFVPSGNSDASVYFRAASSLRSVMVLCNEADLIVTVNKDLFGIGHLVKESDLTLGSVGCPPTYKNATAAVFQYGLHECGSSVEMTEDALVYNIDLYYSPSSSLVIIRTNEAVVPIQCYYPRKDNVSSNAIQPTWIPFRSTVSSEQKLNFTLRLMNDDWSSVRQSTEYYLGDVLHIEASVSTDNHAPLRLFIDSCVATLQEDENSVPKYSIIDNYGCLTDSRATDSSAFLSPRFRDDLLRFDLSAFRFFKDSRSMIYITCHLKAVSISLSPDAINKACSFTWPGNIWSPVEGFNNICSCCETGNCGPAKQLIHPSGRRSSGRSFRRHGKRSASRWTQKGDAHTGPIMILSSFKEVLQEVSTSEHPQNSSGLNIGMMSLVIAGLAGAVIFSVAAIVYVKLKSLTEVH